MMPGKPLYLTPILLIIFFCSALQAESQDSLTVKGTVTDDSHHPISLVVVEIRSDTGDATLTVNTDSLGGFFFEKQKAGRFRLTASYTGYAIKDTLLDVSAQSQGTIVRLRLIPSPSVLQAVNVTARRNFMQVENDKKVFYPNAFGGVSSGSAADVMEHVPLIDADKDGNLTIRGKAANVLINGKPSSFSDISTALQMIPSAEIDKIEVMTTPSAKYDAQGKGGIVNLVLKKQQVTGWHGVINIDVASQPDEHAGADLNYRKGKFNVFGKINGHTRQIRGNRTTTQQFSARDSARHVLQQVGEYGFNHDIDGQAGIDFFLNGQTTITALQGWSRRDKESGNSLVTDTGFSAMSLRQLPVGFSLNKNSTDALTSDLQLSHHFRKSGELLTVDLQRSDNRTQSLMSLGKPGAAFQQQLAGKKASVLYSLQADYELPLGKSGKMETGWKSTVQQNQADLLAEVRTDSLQTAKTDSSLSTLFSYYQAVHAFYITYSGNLGHFQYKTGLRAEDASLSGNSYFQHAAVRSDIFRLFPSFFLTREFNHGQNVELSYSTRITRPDFAQLLPYTDLSNPINRQTGNPGLSPEYSQSLELNYSKSFEKSGNFVDWALFYSCTSNSIQQVTQPDSSGISITSPQNIPDERSLGSDLILRISLFRRIHLNPSFDVRFSRFTEDARVATTQKEDWSFSYQMKLEGSIDLPAHFSLLSHGEITGPQILPQGTFRQNKGIDLEVKRGFFRKKLTAALIASDILYDRGQRSVLSTPVLFQTERYRENSRQLHVHVSWAF